MHDSALYAVLFFLFCAMPLMSSSAHGHQDSAASDAQRVEGPAIGLGDYAPPTKEQKLASCMALWEPETHMTKTLWKTVCKRLETKD